jgi:hypothetical protein
MTLHEEPTPAAFYPHAQHAAPFLYNFVIPYEGGPKQVIPEVVKAVREIDPQLPLWRLFDPRADGGGLAIRRADGGPSLHILRDAGRVLASIGIYGVTSYGIAKRTNEFGIRMPWELNDKTYCGWCSGMHSGLL